MQSLNACGSRKQEDAPGNPLRPRMEESHDNTLIGMALITVSSIVIFNECHDYTTSRGASPLILGPAIAFLFLGLRYLFIG